MMACLYWAIASLILFITTSIAISTLRLGWIAQGVSQAITPVVWIALCSAMLLVLSRNTRPGALKAGGQALLVTLSIVGAVIGELAGLFSGIGLSYGVGDVELSHWFVMFFGLGALLALVPGLLAGAIAAWIALANKRPPSMSDV